MKISAPVKKYGISFRMQDKERHREFISGQLNPKWEATKVLCLLLSEHYEEKNIYIASNTFYPFLC